jgi:hypothetical protein
LRVPFFALRPSAKAWAVAASVFHLVVFPRQFVIAVRPTITWYRCRLSSLIVGFVGIVAFLSPDQQMGAAILTAR